MPKCALKLVPPENAARRADAALSPNNRELARAVANTDPRIRSAALEKIDGEEALIYIAVKFGLPDTKMAALRKLSSRAGELKTMRARCLVWLFSPCQEEKEAAMKGILAGAREFLGGIRGAKLSGANMEAVTIIAIHSTEPSIRAKADEILRRSDMKTDPHALDPFDPEKLAKILDATQA